MMYKTRLIKFIVYTFILSLHLYRATGQEIYVSPAGDDNNPGTEQLPFKSIEKVMRVIRASRDSITTVKLSGGVYRLKKPLLFGPGNGKIIFKANDSIQPVISGGYELKNFEKTENGIWKVILPDTLKNKRFDRLYVNGNKAVLARYPDSGFLKIVKVEEIIIEKGEGRVPLKAIQRIYLDNDVFKYLKNVKTGNLRFRVFHKWDFSLRYVDSINYAKGYVITSGKGMKPWNSWKKGSRLYFENFKKALDKPGEWFYNGEGTLFYYPEKNQTPENTVFTVPVLNKFIEIKGTPIHFVNNVTFDGIKFTFCGYPFDKKGFEPNQAAVSEDAAITVEAANNVTFLNCEVTNTGQHAIKFDKGARNCLVEHCFIHDIGGGGIYIGDIDVEKDYGLTKNITADNNIIMSGGREYPPAVGIWIGKSSDNKILHNDICDLFYTGISVGWVWGYSESLSKRNIIKFNNIHHIGWDLLSDMAGVYTLGKSEGTVISDNVIHHINAYSYGGWGLYTDEGSSGILMENNLVYSTKTGSFHQHYGKNNIIRNNIFAFAKLYQLQCTRVENHLSFVLKHNIIVFDRGELLKGPWFKMNIEMDSNIYWNTERKKIYFLGKRFGQWKRKTGHDIHSFINNPRFVDARKFNFDLITGKKVKLINFKPFDFKKAGVYGSDEWKKKAGLPEKILMEFDEVVNKNLSK